MPLNTQELLRSNENIVRDYSASKQKKAELLFKNWSQVFISMMKYKGCNISILNLGNKVVAEKINFKATITWRDPNIYEDYIELEYINTGSVKNVTITTPQLDHFSPSLFDPLYGSDSEQSDEQKILNLYQYNQTSFYDLDLLNFEYSYKIKSIHFPYIQKVLSETQFSDVKTNLSNIEYTSAAVFLTALDGVLGTNLTLRYGKTILNIIQESNFPIIINSGDMKYFTKNGNIFDGLVNIYGVKDFSSKNVTYPMAVITHEDITAVGRDFIINGAASIGINLTYQWSITDQAGNTVEIVKNNTQDIHFFPSYSATYTVQLEVIDNAQQISRATSSFISNENAEAKFIEINNIYHRAYSALTTQFEFSTANLCKGDIVSYSWSEKEGKGSFSNLDQEDTIFTPEENGTYVIQLSVIDSSGEQSPIYSVDVNVSQEIIAIFTIQPSSKLGTQNFTTFLLDATESTGKLLNYSWSIIDPDLLPMDSFSSINAPQLSFRADKIGDYKITLTITDNSHNISNTSSEETITVAEAPSISISADETNLNIIFSGLGYRATMETISLSSLINNTGTVSIYEWRETLTDGSLGSFDSSAASSSSFIPTNAGEFNFQLIATDPNGAKAYSNEITYTVSEAPQAIFTVDKLSGSIDGNAFKLYASNSVGDDLTYSWSYTIPDGTTGTLVNFTQQSSVNSDLSLTDGLGDYKVALTVTDGNGATDTSSELTLTLIDKPVADISVIDSSLTIGQTEELNFNLSAINVHGRNPYTYFWSVVSAPVGSSSTDFSVNNSATESTIFTADIVGTYKIRLNVTDSESVVSDNIETDIYVLDVVSISIEITPPAPFTLNTTLDGPIVYGLDASYTIDPHVAAYTHEWSVLSHSSANSGVFANNNNKVTTYTVTEAGDYQIELIVTDDNGVPSASDTQSFTVSPKPIAKPFVESSSTYSAIMGKTLNLQANASEGNIVEYEWTVTNPTSPIGTMIGGVSTSTLTSSNELTTFSASNADSYTLSLRVKDINDVWSVSETVAIEITEVPVANIVATNIRDINAITLTPSLEIELNASGSTPVITKYTWNITSSPNGGVGRFEDGSGNINNQIVNPKFIPNISGDWSIELIVEDANGEASVPVSMDFTIYPFPIANFVFEESASDPFEYNLNGSGSTPVNNINSYSWVCEYSNGGGNGTFSSISDESTTFNGNLAGDYTVKLIVTDSDGETSEMSKIITLTAPLTALIDGPTTGFNGDLGIYNVTPSDSANYTYEWKLTTPPTSAAALFSADQSSAIFSIDEVGIYKLKVILTDTIEDVSSEATKLIYICDGTMHVTPIPYANFNVLNFDLEVNTLMDLDASDCIGDDLSYSWSLDKKPSGSTTTIANSGTLATFTPDLEGTYRVTLSVTDGSTGLIETDTKDIEIIL